MLKTIPALSEVMDLDKLKATLQETFIQTNTNISEYILPYVVVDNIIENIEELVYITQKNPHIFFGMLKDIVDSQLSLGDYYQQCYLVLAQQFQNNHNLAVLSHAANASLSLKKLLTGYQPFILSAFGRNLLGNYSFNDHYSASITLNNNDKYERIHLLIRAVKIVALDAIEALIDAIYTKTNNVSRGESLKEKVTFLMQINTSTADSDGINATGKNTYTPR